MSGISPEIQTAVDALSAAANGVEEAASKLLEALEVAQNVGSDLRQLDVDTIRTRFLGQIPYAIRVRAGQLLPPITGTLNIQFDEAKAGGV